MVNGYFGNAALADAARMKLVCGCRGIRNAKHFASAILKPTHNSRGPQSTIASRMVRESRPVSKLPG